jgi:hypothetical protein
MLQIVENTNIETEGSAETGDELFCAACGHLLTRGRWRISMNGDHEHTVFNPAGRVFTVLCFKEAPGVAPIGDASGDFTWFKGYVWRIGACRGCDSHIGWRFEGETVFFGLIKSNLTDRKP